MIEVRMGLTLVDRRPDESDAAMLLLIAGQTEDIRPRTMRLARARYSMPPPARHALFVPLDDFSFRLNFPIDEILDMRETAIRSKNTSHRSKPPRRCFVSFCSDKILYRYDDFGEDRSCLAANMLCQPPASHRQR